ncbi:hypothetical protein [uncultured Hymenobacter sp.]|uniref:hypothetical protein n=1 Tax=uncultured Hymenobacter sp. TaxID=170016 RepID=UPI0035CB7308
MKRFSSRRVAFTTLASFSLAASTLLTGCFEKDTENGDCTSPTGGTCTIAATVVDLSATTGCGLALQLADNTYLVPTGSTWTDYHATAGNKVLVGYTPKKRGARQTTCPAGPLVELGCISVNTTTTTGAF